MKKFSLLVATFLLLSIGVAAQNDSSDIDTAQTEVVDSTEEAVTAPDESEKEDIAKINEQLDKKVPEKKYDTYEVIKIKFVEGGVEFMSIVLICLILGLAIAIERIIALNLASTNTDVLLNKTKQALQNGGAEEAKMVTSNVPGPVASLFTQGLLRYKKGIESVEKAIIQFGGVEMGKLEKGMTWIALFIALAPMFGFMGTVIGMIDAFDQIEQSETIKIDEVASGIKTALLTTVAGLIVAVILQIFYNYCISKIDAIVNQMEEASISFVDMLIEEELIEENKD